MSYRKLFLVGCMAVACVGCGAEPSDPEPAAEQGFVEEDGPVTPGDADDADYCAEFGWYSDGTCDDFCRRPDPDCGGSDVEPCPGADNPDFVGICAEPGPDDPGGEPSEPDDPDTTPNPDPEPEPEEPVPVEPLPIACYSDDNPHVKRVGDTEECTLINFACEQNWEYFADDCGCGCVEVRSCTSDGDCSNGYCEQTPDGGFCAYPNCDQPTDVMCNAIAPDCGPGLVAAAIDGCWQCVDARTCEVPRL